VKSQASRALARLREQLAAETPAADVPAADVPAAEHATQEGPA
jgi:hypothetical protein